MAQYKDPKYLSQNSHSAFDELHQPGQVADNSGIYRCEGCGREVAANKNNSLPSQNHHQHRPGEGHIRWRLVVFAEG
jgi:hypothetical protein